MSELQQNKFKWLDTPINRERARDTGMAITLIFLLLGFFSKNDLYFKIAIPILIIDMAVPIVYKPLAYVWFGLAHILGTVVSKILLLIVFSLVVMPMAFLRRMMGKDPMFLKAWKVNNQSAFTVRNHLYTPSDIQKPY